MGETEVHLMETRKTLVPIKRSSRAPDSADETSEPKISFWSESP